MKILNKNELSSKNFGFFYIKKRFDLKSIIPNLRLSKKPEKLEKPEKPEKLILKNFGKTKNFKMIKKIKLYKVEIF
jgi:hypothetical protein